jgi:hypothetical protein
MVTTDPARQLEHALALIAETQGLLELARPADHRPPDRPVARTTLGHSFRLSFPFLFPHPPAPRP